MHRSSAPPPGVAWPATCESNGAWSVEYLLADQDVRCLAADPIHLGVVYAGMQGQGVLRSDDRGGTWSPPGLDGRIVKALAVSPTELGVVYAGTKPPLLFVSHDGGTNGTELEAFRRIPGRWWLLSPAEWPPVAYVQGIVLAPTDPNVIVVGVEAGAMVRSKDGGETWSGHRPGAVRDCHSIAFHATSGDWVYEGGGTGAGVSQDDGTTWQQPRAGLDRRYCWACAADPARPDVWYVSAALLFTPTNPLVPTAHVDGKANASIFRRIGSEPWRKLAGGLPQPLSYMAYVLLTDPAAPGHLYAG